MSWNDLKSIWRGCTPTDELSGEDIMKLLEGRSAEIRRQIANRLREETGYYVLMLGFALAVSLVDFSWKTLAYPLVACVTIGLLIATLHHQARRMRSVDLAGSVRQTLQVLLARVDGATRAYMAAYLFLMLAHLALGMGAIIVAQRDHPVVIALSLAAGLVALALLWWSGRHYLESRFGGYRERLSRCLAELDPP